MKNSLTLTLLCIVCACIGFGQNCDQNISFKVFTRTDPRCSNYQGTYCSHIQDKTTGTPPSLEGKLIITYSADTGTCGFATNGIPNHNVNDGTSKFQNAPAPVDRVFYVKNSPTVDPKGPTLLGTNRYNAILLNGAIVDLVADGCCVGGKDKLAGCGDPAASWRLDPMNPAAGFTKDTHNAHCQADGTYHYHGPPIGLYEYPSTKVSPVIGFAADGFPIHGPYFEDNKGVIRAARSSYRKAPTDRPQPLASGQCPVGTKRDGKYIQDYVYVAGFGDLDECNGMIVKGQYYYFVTHDYPYIMKCFKGTPDTSFDHTDKP